MMSSMHAEIGDQVRFAKTVSESDIYLFAGITGDFSGNHVNEEFMKNSVYRHRIAHGVLLIGYMSTCSTRMIERSMVSIPPRCRSATTGYAFSPRCT